jgi:hypothetical protein
VTSKRKEPQVYEVSEEFQGDTYKAKYTVTSGCVSVHSTIGPKFHRDYGKLAYPELVIGPSHEFTAREIIRRVLEGAKERGEI